MIRDVDVSLESGEEEIHVAVARERTLQAGLSTQAVAHTVANALSSRAVSHFKTGDREVDLITQYREEDRETLDQLKNMPVYAENTPLPLGALADFEFVPGGISITSTVVCTGKTGVEMEALTAVSAAALAIYDMCKAVDREMSIGPIGLVEKSGGKSGHFLRETQNGLDES